MLGRISPVKIRRSEAFGEERLPCARGRGEPHAGGILWFSFAPLSFLGCFRVLVAACSGLAVIGGGGVRPMSHPNVILSEWGKAKSGHWPPKGLAKWNDLSHASERAERGSCAGAGGSS